MIIRKARLKDVETLISAWKEFVSEHDSIVIGKSPEKEKRRRLIKGFVEKKKRDFQKRIRSKNSIVFLAVKNNEIIGFSINTIKKYDELFKLKQYGYMDDLYVKPEFRGKKVSSQLKEEAIKWFKEKGMKHASLGFNSENSKAHKIYKKWGFCDEYTEMMKDI